MTTSFLLFTQKNQKLDKDEVINQNRIIRGISYTFAIKRILWPFFIVFVLVLILPYYRRYTPNYTFSDRWKTGILVEYGRDNDILMFLGLERIGVEYYLKRFDNVKTFEKFSFPGEIDEVHPCWSNFKKMSDREKKVLNTRINRIKEAMSENDARLWVFWDHSRSDNEEIESVLSAAFKKTAEIHKKNGNLFMTIYERKYPHKEGDGH